MKSMESPIHKNEDDIDMTADLILGNGEDPINFEQLFQKDRNFREASFR